MIIHLLVGFIKKRLYKLSQYFRKPYKSFGGDINVKVDLSIYATKPYLENATEANTSKLTTKTDLASLKVKFDKIDVDKLKIAPIDLSKISNVANNNVVRKTVCDKVVAKTK